MSVRERCCGREVTHPRRWCARLVDVSTARSRSRARDGLGVQYEDDEERNGAVGICDWQWDSQWCPLWSETARRRIKGKIRGRTQTPQSPIHWLLDAEKGALEKPGVTRYLNTWSKWYSRVDEDWGASRGRQSKSVGADKRDGRGVVAISEQHVTNGGRDRKARKPRKVGRRRRSRRKRAGGAKRGELRDSSGVAHCAASSRVAEWIECGRHGSKQIRKQWGPDGPDVSDVEHWCGSEKEWAHSVCHCGRLGGAGFGFNRGWEKVRSDFISRRPLVWDRE
ncbi:hypothetical protein K438DRAFT_1929997 [Mycena galopus ATCC 62051]|nr:hypothetical protein K438DRAFT_1929997 [Mycena galopus ATCC 62051]